MKPIKEKLLRLIDEADAIVIGAGAGLSTAAGFEYGGKTFMDNFSYMHERYGYNDMYSAGFHHFDSSEERWAYWSKMIYLNRYQSGPKDLYKRLLALLKGKNYFVITTNVDHQFQLAGFDKNRLFYTQGDYGLFQCSVPCQNKTYDNKNQILEMVHSIIDNKIPTSMIPHCPVCHKEMSTNLRCDDTFVEDEGWHKAKRNYETFLKNNRGKRIVFLELGVGYSTPVWIKYPFMKMTYENLNATYVCIDKGVSFVPDEIKRQSILINESISDII